MVYQHEHDVTLKTGLKSRRSPEEIVETGSIAEFVARIKEQQETEAEQDKDDAADDDVEIVQPTAAKVANDDIDLGEAKLAESDKEEVQRFKKEADRLVRTHCQLITKPRTVAQLSAAIRESKAGTLDKDEIKSGNGRVLVFYATSVSGEAATNPQTRKPPLRQHYRDCLQAMLESRPKSNEINESDVYFLLDGGRHGPQR